MWKWMGLLLGKIIFLRCWGWLKWIGTIIEIIWIIEIISIAKTTSKKIWVLMRFMKIFSLRLPFISVNLPYGHTWSTIVMFGLVLLVTTWNCKISNKKLICRTVGPWLATSFEPLAHSRNVTSLSLLYRYYFGRCSSELPELVPLSYSRGSSTCYSDSLYDFSVTYVNSFFLRTAKLWNAFL